MILKRPVAILIIGLYLLQMARLDNPNGQPFMSGEGEKLFHDGLKAKNTVSCDQCHPNGANIHPETYPKFQQQLGKVAVLGEMINWCIMNPTESDPLELDSDEMVALQVYIHWERRGVKLAPGKH